MRAASRTEFSKVANGTRRAAERKGRCARARKCERRSAGARLDAGTHAVAHGGKCANSERGRAGDEALFGGNLGVHAAVRFLILKGSDRCTRTRAFYHKKGRRRGGFLS